jgi:hypothetical protein
MFVFLIKALLKNIFIRRGRATTKIKFHGNNAIPRIDTYVHSPVSACLFAQLISPNETNPSSPKIGLTSSFDSKNYESPHFYVNSEPESYILQPKIKPDSAKNRKEYPLL